MNLVQRARRGRSESRYSLEQYVADVAEFWYSGHAYAGVTQTYGAPGSGQRTERSESPFEHWVQGGYKTNGVVFACVLARLMLFTESRFQWQRMTGGRPGDLFGTAELALLERPWVNGNTGELLARMIQDLDLAGNAYVRRTAPMAGRAALERLRPDWVSIVLGRNPDMLTPEVVGYLYEPAGPGKSDAVALAREEVAHWAHIPDPLASYRGMSWLTPVLREIRADGAATDHKQKFFDNSATPNMVIKFDPSVTAEKLEKFRSLMESEHRGVANAYKNLYLGGGADATVVGTSFRQMDFKAVQGAGEPLALDTPIPTPTGWSTMGELRPGAEVFGRNGLPAHVLAVSPVHTGRQCYRVTFNDRSSIVADAGHIWTARDRATNDRADRDYTTEQLASLLADWERRGAGGNRMGIAPAAALKLPDIDLLVDPYVLGAWLGDGHTAGAAICGAEDDLNVIAAEIESRGYTVSRWAAQPDRCSVIGLPGGLLAALRALDVLGNKHIPGEYLRASIEQRLDLLRGLMDTDGTVGARGKETCEFSSKYESLARQVLELVRSLGHRASITSKIDERSKTGQTWRVTFRADPEMVPFALPRKAARCVTPVWVKNRAIVSIEPVESVPVRCITVDTPDHLFLAGEGMVPTHNTRIAAAAGVPPIIVGLSEGLQAATYSNYAQARRKFADMTIRPLWRSCAGALESIMRPPPGTRLWYDDRDIPALQEDEKDAADIEMVKAQTIATLVRDGFKPDSVVAAVLAQDMGLLEHTGALSVQLVTPGATPPAQTEGEPDDAE